MQAEFPTKVNRGFLELKAAIRDGVLKKAPRMRWQAAHWVVLKSLPDGVEQQSHHDIPNFENSRAQDKYNSIQAGIMVGLMPHTVLIVYESCFSQAVEIKRKVIKYGLGDCLLFRGDLVHSGASLPELNYRVHLTVTVKGIAWAEDVTELAPTTRYKCKFCPEMYGIRTKLRDHTRFCAKNPNHKKNVGMQKAFNDKGKTRELCNLFFPKANSCYTHRRRKHTTTV